MLRFRRGTRDSSIGARARPGRPGAGSAGERARGSRRRNERRRATRDARDFCVDVVDVGVVGVRRVASRDRVVAFADRRRLRRRHFVLVFAARFSSRGIVAYGRRAEERGEEPPEHRRRSDVHAFRPSPVRRGRIRAVISCVRRLRGFRSSLARAIGPGRHRRRVASSRTCLPPTAASLLPRGVGAPGFLRRFRVFLRRRVVHQRVERVGGAARRSRRLFSPRVADVSITLAPPLDANDAPLVLIVHVPRAARCDHAVAASNLPKRGDNELSRNEPRRCRNVGKTTRSRHRGALVRARHSR